MELKFQGSSLPLLVASAACALLSLFGALHAPVNDDDVYHLHSLWLFAHGLVPYRDFFEIHPPGLWVLAGPVARAFETPSQYFLAARILIAGAVGLGVWLAGRAVQAGGAQALILGALMLGVVSRCQIWMFRVEYLAALLLLVGLSLVAGGDERHGARAVLAAAAVGLGSTISVRLLPFVAVQPLAHWWAAPRAWRRAGTLWVAGTLLGTAPAAIYLTVHGLWRDAWFWSVHFVSSSDVVWWGFEIGPADVALVVFGLVAVALLSRADGVSLVRRSCLAGAWAVAVAFHLSNPQKVDYAGIYLLMTTAMLLTAVVPLISARQPLLRRDTALVVVAVAVIFFLRLLAGLSLPLDRDAQRLQLKVLDWLQVVAGNEGVVLVAPYHPMTVRDATDLQNPGYYSFWLGSSAVRARLAHFGETVLAQPPPVIAADPWPEHTSGMDLPAWLAQANVLAPEEVARLRALIAERYSSVSFPPLAAWPFGHTFWVRRDRLEAAPPPTPSVLSRSGR